MLIVIVVVVDWGRTLLTSQIFSVASYSEREKSEKFCSVALISAWGSFTCRKTTTWTHGFSFLPKEVILRIFTLWKNPSTPAEFESANLGPVASMITRGPPRSTQSLIPEIILIYALFLIVKVMSIILISFILHYIYIYIYIRYIWILYISSNRLRSP